MHEINGEAIFSESVKTFDGFVFKEDFIYQLLQQEIFTLDRGELANLATLMDGDKIDLNELQFSYKSYIKY